MNKEKYKGPFLLVQKGATHTHTSVWIEMLCGRLEPYFESEIVTVQDLNGNVLKLEDCEMPKYKQNYE